MVSDYLLQSHGVTYLIVLGDILPIIYQLQLQNVWNDNLHFWPLQILGLLIISVFPRSRIPTHSVDPR